MFFMSFYLYFLVSQISGIFYTSFLLRAFTFKILYFFIVFCELLLSLL